MKIRLYIGAHKTATTHVQSILELNKDILYKNNIKVSLPSELRVKWLTSFLKYIKKNDPILLEDVLREIPESGVWIIAEENISGVSYEYLSSNEIYPNLKERLQYFKRIFNEHEIEIFFSIRSYETYYRSAYLEVVRNNGYLPFTDFYEESRFKNNSWLKVINTFCEFFSQDKINIWRYEDFEEVLPVVLNNLTSDNIINHYPKGKTRPSISEKTLKILQENEALLNKDESKALLEILNKKYPAGKELPVFMPFDELQVKEFRSQYEVEVRSLKEKFPSMNLFGQFS